MLIVYTLLLLLFNHMLNLKIYHNIRINFVLSTCIVNPTCLTRMIYYTLKFILFYVKNDGIFKICCLQITIIYVHCYFFSL